jgi:hypothetical protein
LSAERIGRRDFEHCSIAYLSAASSVDGHFCERSRLSKLDNFTAATLASDGKKDRMSRNGYFGVITVLAFFQKLPRCRMGIEASRPAVIS